MDSAIRDVKSSYPFPATTSPMMDLLFKVDWYQMFFPSVSLAELVIRGTLVYLMLFTIFRLLPNRQVGMVGMADLLVVILFADAAQNAMASNYQSITDGLILVGTITFWSYVLNWLGYQFPFMQRFLSPPPLLLVKKGRLLYHNMRRELIVESELMSQLRKQGVEKLEEVKLAFMEADGTISIIPYGSKLLKKSEQTVEETPVQQQ